MPLILQPLNHYAQFGLNVQRPISFQIHRAEVCGMMFTQVHQLIFVASLTLTLLSFSFRPVCWYILFPAKLTQGTIYCM